MSYNGRMGLAARNAKRRPFVWAFITACAAGICVYAGSAARSQPAFLRGAKLVAVSRDRAKSTIRQDARTTTYFYTLPGDWEDVYGRAKSDLPFSLESKLGLASRDSKELIVPRRDGDRISIMFPPEKIVYVSPGKLVLDKTGQPVRMKSTDEPWTTVEILDFRRDSALDQLAEWIRKKVHI
jgi:hypothetical protein